VATLVYDAVAVRHVGTVNARGVVSRAHATEVNAGWTAPHAKAVHLAVVPVQGVAGSTLVLLAYAEELS